MLLVVLELIEGFYLNSEKIKHMKRIYRPMLTMKNKEKRL